MILTWWVMIQLLLLPPWSRLRHRLRLTQILRVRLRLRLALCIYLCCCWLLLLLLLLLLLILLMMSAVLLAHPGSSIVLTTNQTLLATWPDRSQSPSLVARLGIDIGCSANARTDCEDGYHPGHIYISDLRSYPDTHTSVFSWEYKYCEPCIYIQ